MNIVIPTKSLKSLPSYLGSFTNPKLVNNALLASALNGVQIIQDRTENGRGYKGLFAPYNRQYAAWKRKRGNVFSKPNLELTGDMMRDMQTRTGRNYADIYFTSPESARKAVWNNRTRPFFGFNEAEKKKLIKRFTTNYMEQIAKLKRRGSV